MTKPIVTIHNLETDEILEREMTDLEYAQYEKDLKELEDNAKEQAAKNAARQAVLDKLGLSADEVAALLG